MYMYVGMHVLELQIMYVHFVVGIGGVMYNCAVVKGANKILTSNFLFPPAPTLPCN